MMPPLTLMPPTMLYDVEATKVLCENARKELARYDHSKDIKTQIKFKPKQQNVADIVQVEGQVWWEDDRRMMEVCCGSDEIMDDGEMMA